MTTPGPWKLKPDEGVFAEGVDAALGVIGPNDEPVLEIDYGGFACESDPWGAYPVIVATPGNWSLLLAAPELLAVLEAAEKWIDPDLRSACPYETNFALLEGIRQTLAAARNGCHNGCQPPSEST